MGSWRRRINTEAGRRGSQWGFSLTDCVLKENTLFITEDDPHHGWGRRPSRATTDTASSVYYKDVIYLHTTQRLEGQAKSSWRMLEDGAIGGEPAVGHRHSN